MYQALKYHRDFRRRLAAGRAAFARREARVGYPPFYLFVEPTNVCNLRCTSCPQCMPGFFTEDNPRGRMDLDLFASILDQARGRVFKLFLFLNGEPLMHPQLARMVRMAAERGIYVHTTTNAALLTREKSRELIGAGLDDITFSFEVDRPEEYDALRVNSSYATVLENIQGFLTVRRQAGRRSMGAKLRALNNRAALRRLKRAALGTGGIGGLGELLSRLPYTRISALTFGDDSHPEPGGDARALLDRYLLDNLEFNYAHNWSGEFSAGVEYSLTEPGERYHMCDHVYNYLAVRWDGRVQGCCRDMLGNYVLGDLSRETLMDVWNGERMASLREALWNERYQEIELCRRCERLWIPPGAGLFD